VIDYKQGDAAAAVLESTGGSGVDRVIELDIAANAGLDSAVVAANGDWVVYGSGAPRFSLGSFRSLRRTSPHAFSSCITSRRQTVRRQRRR
jgi:NADPH:quinone reductase